jgi:hypothetical protein
VAMESSSVYWVPIFNVLEEELNLEQLLVGKTPSTSRRCPGARPTSWMPSGSPTCFSTACYGESSSLIAAGDEGRIEMRGSRVCELVDHPRSGHA